MMVLARILVSKSVYPKQLALIFRFLHWSVHSKYCATEFQWSLLFSYKIAGHAVLLNCMVTVCMHYLICLISEDRQETSIYRFVIYDNVTC